MKSTLLLVLFLLMGNNICAQSYYSISHQFNNNFPGGVVIVDGFTYDAPVTLPYSSGDNSVHSATAINNQYSDNYLRVFKEWRVNDVFYTPNLTHTFGRYTGFDLFQGNVPDHTAFF